MEKGGFKWTSNSRVFRDQIALDQQPTGEESTAVEIRENERNRTLESGENQDGSVKVLVVPWNSDEFDYDLSQLGEHAKTLPATKRLF